MDLTKQKAQTNEVMLKEAKRIFDEFAKTLEKQVVSSPTENFIIDWKSKFKEFVSLVKKMREAQNEERKWGIVNFKTEEDKVACSEAIKRMYQLESEVDEYLKMEEHGRD